MACHITTHVHNATNDPNPFPEPWREAMDRHQQYVSERIEAQSRVVGYPVGDDRVRWARMDIYRIHPR